MIKKGDLDFIRKQDPSLMKELVSLGPRVPFYVGIKLQKMGDTERAIAALMSVPEDPSIWIQQTKYQTLVPLLMNNKRTEEAYKILTKAGNDSTLKDTPWYRALMTEILFAEGRYKDIIELQGRDDIHGLSIKTQGIGLFARFVLAPGNQSILDSIEAFFLSGSLTESHRELFTAIQQVPNLFLPQTLLFAIRGRFFIIDRSYGDALYYLKLALHRNRYLFEAYPDLLADLGKAYQYSGETKEGIALFSDWDATIVSGQYTQALITNADRNELRFRLMFYTGRMARQTGDFSNSINYFYRALPLAPDMQQRDACIWYLLETNLQVNSKDFPKVLNDLIPIWSNPSYFDDLLDKVCTSYTSDQNWNGLLQVFTTIYKKTDNPEQARYAYILARAVSEGFNISNENLDLLGIPPGSTRSAVAKAFYKIAFETDNASYYYRSLAAAFLGEQLQILPDPSEQSMEKKTNNSTKAIDPNSLLAYLFGFFEWGCADIALPYILEYKHLVTEDEARHIAGMFGEQGRWGDQIQLVSKALISRKNYTPNRDDFELLYPLPYRAIMEPIALQHKIPIEIFYGLVRSESAFIPDVKSNAGAIGLTQLMLSTAQDVAWRIKRAGGPDFSIQTAVDLEDPETNLYIGAWYLSYLIERTGSPLLAMASYNGGMTRVRKWRNEQAKLAEDLFLETIPFAETREYNRRVLAAAAVYGYLYFNMSMGAVFADIFPVQQTPLEAQ